jgi:hypothetical protein
VDSAGDAACSDAGVRAASRVPPCCLHGAEGPHYFAETATCHLLQQIEADWHHHYHELRRLKGAADNLNHLQPIQHRADVVPVRAAGSSVQEKGNNSAFVPACPANDIPLWPGMQPGLVPGAAECRHTCVVLDAHVPPMGGAHQLRSCPSVFMQWDKVSDKGLHC